MKQLKTLQFVEGTLSVKSQQNGWAEFIFDENQIEFRPKEERTYAVIKIAHFELIALRDFLNEALPLAPCDDAEFGMRD